MTSIVGLVAPYAPPMATRAMVLGGGGPVGIAWQAGLLVGLTAGGVDPARADLVAGTSAGSVVGAQLTLGRPLQDTVGFLAGLTAQVDSERVTAQARAFMEVMLTAPADRTAAARAIGRLAADADTIPEGDYVALFAPLASEAWPEAFACTGVDVETGELRVFDAAAGVALRDAVACSCAVPLVFPPVTIDGRRYTDGGVTDPLNPAVARGSERTLAISCFALELPEGVELPAMQTMLDGTNAELDRLRTGGALEVVVPGDEFQEVSGGGIHLMDALRAGAAYDAGLRQADAELDRVRALWD